MSTVFLNYFEHFSGWPLPIGGIVIFGRFSRVFVVFAAERGGVAAGARRSFWPCFWFFMGHTI
jgi:hypothetical protein